MSDRMPLNTVEEVFTWEDVPFEIVTEGISTYRLPTVGIEVRSRQAAIGVQVGRDRNGRVARAQNGEPLVRIQSQTIMAAKGPPDS